MLGGQLGSIMGKGGGVPGQYPVFLGGGTLVEHGGECT
jgi:hypothetical protein